MTIDHKFASGSSSVQDWGPDQDHEDGPNKETVITHGHVEYEPTDDYMVMYLYDENDNLTCVNLDSHILEAVKKSLGTT